MVRYGAMRHRAPWWSVACCSIVWYAVVRVWYGMVRVRYGQFEAAVAAAAAAAVCITTGSFVALLSFCMGMAGFCWLESLEKIV